MPQSAYERRIERYMREHPGATRQDARGHGRTPEHPDRAEKDPDKYRDYLARREALERQVAEKKERDFAGGYKFRADRSARAVHKNPATKRPARMDYMRRYISPGFSFDEIDWADDDWGFLYYH